MDKYELIAELQAIWQGIGPDALDANGGKNLNAEEVRDLVSTQVGGVASTQLTPESARLWKTLESDRGEMEKILQEAFPNGNYGY